MEGKTVFIAGDFLICYPTFLKFHGIFREVIPGSYKSYVENRALAKKLSLLACIQICTYENNHCYQCSFHPRFLRRSANDFLMA